MQREMACLWEPRQLQLRRLDGALKVELARQSRHLAAVILLDPLACKSNTGVSFHMRRHMP